jgi:hypothetical protein
LHIAGFDLEFRWFGIEAMPPVNQLPRKHGKMTFVPPSIPPAASHDSPPVLPFVDRRQQNFNAQGGERRQFGNSHHNLTAEGRLLAEAIDNYKLENRRRYITTDELLSVMTKMGYQKANTLPSGLAE